MANDINGVSGPKVELGKAPPDEEQYRIETGPADDRVIKQVLEKCHKEGWRFVCSMALPVSTPSALMAGMGPQLGIVMIFERMLPKIALADC